MSAKIKKLSEILSQLIADSEVDSCALVSTRGQLMAAQLKKDTDEKAVSAMAAAILSIGNRVRTALSSGEPRAILIDGTKKIVIVRSIDKAVIIATAPANAKVGLIDFEMDKIVQNIMETL